MKYYKIVQFFFFLFSISFYFFNASIGYWIFLSFSFFILSILNLKNRFQKSLPSGEVISLIFFIQNTFAIVLIYLLFNKNDYNTESYYLQIPILQYLPFSLLSSQSILLGYSMIEKPDYIWKNYILNTKKFIERNIILKVLFIGIIGSLISILHIPINGFVGYLLGQFTLCALIGLYLYSAGDKKSLYYLIVAIGLILFSVIRSGMFTALSQYSVFFGLLFITKRNLAGKRINTIYFLLILCFGIVLMAFFQNLKINYREKSWITEQDANSSNFYSSAENITQTMDFRDKYFYMSLLGRINEGWLVSCVMEKVPINEPYANGKTIYNSLFNSFLPRVINPNKEEAGGSEKILRFTNLTLEKGVSMNIGTLGETYANFGESGSIVFLLFFGFILGYLERGLLLYSQKQPMVLLFSPIYIICLLTSENDFLWIFNTLTMGTLFIYVVIRFVLGKPNTQIHIGT